MSHPSVAVLNCEALASEQAPSKKAVENRHEQPYLIASVRADLPIAAQTVQIAHAIADCAARSAWQPHTRFVLLKASDQHDLQKQIRLLDEEGITLTTFEEEDYDWGLTAWAFVHRGPMPKCTKRWRLLGS